MNKSRTAHTKRNIFSGMINRGITITLPFLIRTIIIWNLGMEYLGLNSLFVAILQVFNMAELGFSSVIVFKMYKPIAENDEAQVCALLALYRKVYRFIGMAILVTGLLLIPFIQYLIKGSYPDNINIHILYLISLMGTVISYFGYAYKSSLLSAVQRQDIISKVDTVLVIGRSLVQITLLLVFNNYYAYIIWNPVFILANNIVIAVISNKMYPEYICKGKLNQKEIKAITTQIKGLAIGKFALISRNSFDSIALSLFSGLTQVAIYSNYYYIYTSVMSISSVLVTAITAGVGNSIAVETRAKNYQDFKKINFYFAWFGAWGTVCLFCIYQSFMRLWAGENLMAPYGTMLLFCIYFYLAHIGQARSIYSGSAGIWWEFRYLQIGESVSNLILNFILGYYWGMNGILLATIITIFGFSVIGMGKRTFKFYFECSSREYFILLASYAIVTVIVCYVTNAVCSLLFGNGVILILLKIVCCVIIPNLCFLIFAVMNKEHRKYLMDIKRIAVRNF